MDQKQRREYLLRALLGEEKRYSGIALPSEEGEQRRLLRALMNVRPALPLAEETLRVQDEYLAAIRKEKGVVTLERIPERLPGIRLWRGDITQLKVGAIVNAANSGMTGCYAPCHSCIDNCIHTSAGMQLRAFCQKMMEEQGYDEPTGQAKLTPAYNLPCEYILHTVGPIADGGLTEEHEALLASCYRSCLELARARGIGSVAFPCISTGVFRFPAARAAEIALDTVRRCRGEIQVVFNVFKQEDEEIYERLLDAGE